MKKAEVFVQDVAAGTLIEMEKGSRYHFTYGDDYNGPPISLTMPVDKKEYDFSRFPPFFEGLLPEGVLLNSLLKQKKIDRNDLFVQLLTVGGDMVGTVTVKEK